MDNKNYKAWFMVTFSILIVIVLIMAYMFFIKPTWQGYVVNKQLEAKDLTLLALISQIQQQGYAQITIGNQSLYLVPYSPQMAAQQQALAQQQFQQNSNKSK